MTGYFSKYSTVAVITVSALLFACAPAKNVPEGEYLLNRVKVKVDKKEVDTDELYALVRQKPNKRILGVFRFHLWVYNRYKKSEENKVKSTIGEPPVIYDSSLTHRTSEQLLKSMHNRGYYDATVDVRLKLKRKRAKVIYNINAGEAYHIREVKYRIKDDFLNSYLRSDSSNSLLKRGKRFDVELMEKERSRITKLLKNYGYYYFSRDYIYFQADTTVGNKKVDLYIGIENMLEEIPGQEDSLREVEHQKYKIRNIYVNVEYQQNNPGTESADTTEYNGIYFTQSGPFTFTPKALERAIFINKGEYYLLKDQEQTYRRLSALRNFKYINIVFEEVHNADRNLLDCYIRLVPVIDKSFTVETNLTHSGGNNGIEGTVGFQHLNTFHGAEVLNARIKGGLEVQQLSIEGNNDQVIKEFPFNTIEVGPEVSIDFPTFLLPFSEGKFSKNSNPRTSISAAYNFQQRPDYTRNLTNLSLSYSWHETKTKQHIIKPVDISFIKLNKSAEFQERLEATNNSLLINSYNDHFIMAAKYSYILNTQNLAKPQDFVFFRGNLEVAGNLLNAVNNLADRPRTGPEDSYEVFSVRYAQYVRADAELKYYFIYKRSSLVLRTLSGYGHPYGNLKVLPFEKSFYAGGSNDIRAWRVRDLGPGSVPKTLTETDNIDQIGDLKWEGNVEYRFDISTLLEGAFFTDFGNIWLAEKDEKRPNAEINASRLWQDIAIGTGVGLRLDFKFFLIRFDLAARLKDPGMEDPGKIRPELLKSPILNFGIGYPF